MQTKTQFTQCNQIQFREVYKRTQDSEKEKENK